MVNEQVFTRLAGDGFLEPLQHGRALGRAQQGARSVAPAGAIPERETVRDAERRGRRTTDPTTRVGVPKAISGRQVLRSDLLAPLTTLAAPQEPAMLRSGENFLPLPVPGDRDLQESLDAVRLERSLHPVGVAAENLVSS